MLLIGVAALLAFLLAIVLTPLCRNASHKLGLVDRPDRQRKIHRHPVPRTGGVAIFLAIALSVLSLVLAHQRLPELEWSAVFSLMPAFAVVFLTGLLDDIRGLKPWQKLTGQLLAAVLACAAGVRIEGIAGHFIGNTWWHVPLTLFWLVGCANAFNLIDGVDGLAAGIGLFATLTTMVSALLGNNPGLALATALLAGALVGFLRYNFNPASIFLGDCGSLSVGFLLGCFGVIWSQKAATLLGMTAPLIALGIPILEVGLSILRRLLRGQPIFGADRRHIHHRLLDLGFSSRAVVLMMYGAGGIGAGCSVLITISDTQTGGLVVLLFCIAAWIGVQHLGYGEFQVARHVLFGGVLQRVIHSRLTLRQLSDGLRTAQTLDERWELLAGISRRMGFNDIGLSLGGTVRHERLGSVPADRCWKMLVPLQGGGTATFSVPMDATVLPATLAPFAATVSRCMGIGAVRELNSQVAPPSQLEAVPRVVKHA